jgi:hypothetical protein
MEELQIWLKSDKNMNGGITDLTEIGQKYVRKYYRFG